LIGAGSLSKLNCTKHLTGTTILDASRNNIAISSFFFKKTPSKTMPFPPSDPALPLSISKIKNDKNGSS